MDILNLDEDKLKFLTADERQNKTPGLAAKNIAEINLKLSPVIISSTGNIKLISHFTLYLGENLSPLINWAHLDWMTITANLCFSVNYIYLPLKLVHLLGNGCRSSGITKAGEKITIRKIKTMTVFCTTVELSYISVNYF